MRPRLLLMLLLLVAVAVLAWIAWPGGEDDQQPDVAEPERGDVEVQVIGPTGLPLPRVTVRTQDESYFTVRHHTDADGKVLLRDVPRDGSVQAELWYIPIPLTQQHAVLYPRIGVPAHLDLVDAETGDPIREGSYVWRVAATGYDAITSDWTVGSEASGPVTFLARPGTHCWCQVSFYAGKGTQEILPWWDFWMSTSAKAVLIRLPGPSQPGAKMPRQTRYEAGVMDGHAWSLCKLKPRWPKGKADALSVQVLRRDVSPAPWAHVQGPHGVHKADEAGRIKVVCAPCGTFTFTLIEPGMVNTSIEVTAKAGCITNAILQEAEGGDLDIRVVGPNGRGLPFVAIRLDTETRNIPTCWEDEANGIQRIDPFTDHQGKRLYEHVDPGKVTVKATWADREGEATAVVEEGKTTEVEIVLHPPK